MLVRTCSPRPADPTKAERALDEIDGVQVGNLDLADQGWVAAYAEGVPRAPAPGPRDQ